MFVVRGFVWVKYILFYKKKSTPCSPFLPFRTTKQRRNASKLAFSVNRHSRQAAARQSGGPQGTACPRPPVLDESLIQEQTRVDHFWGELSAVGSYIALEGGGHGQWSPGRSEFSSGLRDADVEAASAAAPGCAAGALSAQSSAVR